MAHILYILCGAAATSLALIAALLVAYQRLETAEEKATIKAWFKLKWDSLERSKWDVLPRQFSSFVIEVYNTQQTFLWKIALIFLQICTGIFLLALFFLWFVLFGVYGFDPLGQFGRMRHGTILLDSGDLLLGLAMGLPLLLGAGRIAYGISHSGRKRLVSGSLQISAFQERTSVIVLAFCFLALVLFYLYLVSLLLGTIVEWLFEHTAWGAAFLSFALIPAAFLICLPINVCLPPPQLTSEDRHWVDEILTRYPRGIGAIGLLLLFRVVTGKASPSLPVKKYQLYALAISISGALTAVAFLVGSLMEPGSLAPRTKQFFSINAICDIGTTVLFYRNLQAHASNQIGAAATVIKSITQAGMLALIAAYVGTIATPVSLRITDTLWTFVGRSVGDTRWEFGPTFWAIHTTFLPVFGILVGLMACSLVKSGMLLSRRLLGRALLQHNDPINATAGVLAFLGAIFAVVSLWAKIFE
jgi:hypothetical protein